jgi:hypothetical protein
MSQNSLFSQYSPAITSMQTAGLTNATQLPASLEMGRDGNLSVFYIPFDYVNTAARVVLVGITPGFTQLKNALTEAQEQTARGADEETLLKCCKQTGAFSGGMRSNLVAMLDFIGLNQKLGIASCADFFKSAAGLVQTTSLLRHPVFVGGKNYNGKPDMLENAFLKSFMMKYFGDEAKLLPKAVFVPLGSKVSAGMKYLCQEGMIKEDRVLFGLPHPSGANAERICYFLGRKKRAAASRMINPDAIDADLAALLKKISLIDFNQ